MPEKKRVAQKATAAAPAAKPTAETLTGEHAAGPTAQAGGLPRESTPGDGTPPEPAAATKPARTKSAAVRMLTRPVAGKKPAAARGETQRVADAAKPSQMPQGGGRRGPRRGASKGR